MNIRKFLRWMAAAAAIPGIGMATKVATVREFGQFGSTLDQARQTGFFSWFHLTETGREPRGGTQEVVRFQPSEQSSTTWRSCLLKRTGIRSRRSRCGSRDRLSRGLTSLSRAILQPVSCAPRSLPRISLKQMI